jgi:hypothetical protein
MRSIVKNSVLHFVGDARDTVPPGIRTFGYLHRAALPSPSDTVSSDNMTRVPDSTFISLLWTLVAVVSLYEQTGGEGQGRAGGEGGRRGRRGMGGWEITHTSSIYIQYHHVEKRGTTISLMPLYMFIEKWVHTS